MATRKDNDRMKGFIGKVNGSSPKKTYGFSPPPDAVKKEESKNTLFDTLKNTASTVMSYHPIVAAAKAGTSFIKSQIAENIHPYAYGRGKSSTVERVAKSMFEPERGSLNKSNAADGTALAERQDLLNLMMKGTTPNKSINISNYRPSKSKDKNAVYYSSSVTEETIKEKLKDPNFLKSFNNKGKLVGYHQERDKGGNVLGNFTMSKGKDDKGKYVSYYDKWDLNPFEKSNKFLDKAATSVQKIAGIKPAEVYGRVYYDNIKK